MTIAFVFSGGASLGAIQVGMAQALASHDVHPDLIVGTSVGAINGSWFAGGGDADELAEVWRSLRGRQLFPARPIVGLRAFLGRSTHFVPNSGLRSLLRQRLTFQRLEDAANPFLVVAADAQTGEEVVLDRGPAVSSILASAAIPWVFPPVAVGGHVLFDGGIANNTPITTAIRAGATEVWVLSTGFSCGVTNAPASAFGLAMHAVALMVQGRLVRETVDRTYPVPVHLIPPPCPISVFPSDFSQTDELIDRARSGTLQWLGNGCPDAQPLHVPHEHATNEL